MKYQEISALLISVLLWAFQLFFQLSFFLVYYAIYIISYNTIELTN